MADQPDTLSDEDLAAYGLERCSDGNCIFGGPKGMHTNGGCQHLKERSNITLQKVARALRSERAARVKAERERDEAREALSARSGTCSECNAFVHGYSKPAIGQDIMRARGFDPETGHRESCSRASHPEKPR